MSGLQFVAYTRTGIPVQYTRINRFKSDSVRGSRLAARSYSNQCEKGILNITTVPFSCFGWLLSYSMLARVSSSYHGQSAKQLEHEKMEAEAVAAVTRFNG